MKILVISDPHANKFGLEAVLNAGRDCHAILCLGDIVGYGAHPNECCEMLRTWSANCLSGNHDAAALGKIDTQWFNPIAKAAIEWTSQTLTPENKAWLDSLPATTTYAGLRFQAVHASLRQPWQEYITETLVAEGSLDLMTEPLCFYGHTHEADAYARPAPPSKLARIEHSPLPNGGQLDLRLQWQYLINPGSCGQPRDGNPLAKFAVYDSELKRVTIRTVLYNTNLARDAIIEAGLPRSLGDRLLVGK